MLLHLSSLECRAVDLMTSVAVEGEANTSEIGIKVRSKRNSSSYYNICFYSDNACLTRKTLCPSYGNTTYTFSPYAILTINASGNKNASRKATLLTSTRSGRNRRESQTFTACGTLLIIIIMLNGLITKFTFIYRHMHPMTWRKKSTRLCGIIMTVKNESLPKNSVSRQGKNVKQPGKNVNAREERENGREVRELERDEREKWRGELEKKGAFFFH